MHTHGWKYILHTVYLLHVSDTHVAIFREVRYKEQIHRNIAHGVKVKAVLVSRGQYVLRALLPVTTRRFILHDRSLCQGHVVLLVRVHGCRFNSSVALALKCQLRVRTRGPKMRWLGACTREASCSETAGS
jgi:hypothetical protein